MKPGSKTLQILQVLEVAQDSEHDDQQQIPSRKPHAALHAHVWDLPQITDQVEIGCSGGAFKHKMGAIPPTSAHTDRPGEKLGSDFESALNLGNPAQLNG